MDSLLAPEFNSNEFENLVNLAIECKKSEVKMEQIKKYIAY